MQIKQLHFRWRRWLAVCAAGLAGALLTLAFAPWQWWGLAILCPTLLLWLWQHATPRQALLLGLVFGLGYFGSGVSWVYISIHVHGNTPVPLALFFTFLFVLALALFPALQGYLLNRLFPYKTQRSRLLLAFPALWVVSEWVRSTLLSGFPWLLLGYSQINSPLRSWAPLLGNLGLSFICALIAGLLISLLYGQRRTKIVATIAVFFTLSGTLLLNQLDWTKPQGNPQHVSLIQGNIAQQFKWDPQYFAATLQTYYQLTLPELQQDLIIWPESSVPLPRWVIADELQVFDNLAKRNSSALILGIPTKSEQDDAYYNTIITLGQAQGTYQKRHLVPFGEYLPLDKWLRGLINFFNIPMSNFMPGAVTQSNLETKHVNLGATICYEVAYPNLVYSALPAANILLTVSDDSWFGDSIASAQHLQIAQMRALETGRPLLFATNNGITAVINPRGEITARLPAAKTAVLRATVQPMSGMTPIASFGDSPVVGLAMLLLIAAWLAQHPYWHSLGSGKRTKELP